MKGKRTAVFLDRDGTISDEVGYLGSVDNLRFLPRVTEAIRLINESGLLAVVVTNQAGVARGYFKEPVINEIHEEIERILRKEGAHLDGIYYCPHHPEYGPPEYRKECDCRKPNTGMMEQAARELNIDIKRSYMVGDKVIDMELAHNAGAKGVLVKTGYGKEEMERIGQGGTAQPDYVAEDLYDAVKWILNLEGKQKQ